MTIPSCSVVVCTWDRGRWLERCLAALAGLDHPSYEVVVVDNSQGDSPSQQLAGQFGARYVREPRAGLSRARNTGARAAWGEIVAFTDDDALPDPRWLSLHAE